MSETIYVRLEFEVQVELPEGAKVKKDGEPTKKCRERAIEAALAAIPQSCGIYIDGEDADPTEIFIECSDSDVIEVRVE